MLPPKARPKAAADSLPAKHLHASQNRLKHPINVVLWTPEGRRCLTCSSDGEFTLWNGMAFNFETILRVILYFDETPASPDAHRPMILRSEQPYTRTARNG